MPLSNVLFNGTLVILSKLVPVRASILIIFRERLMYFAFDLNFDRVITLD